MEDTVQVSELHQHIVSATWKPMIVFIELQLDKLLQLDCREGTVKMLWRLRWFLVAQQLPHQLLAYWR